MNRTRMRRWGVSLLLAAGLGAVVSLPLAGPASGQFTPLCVAGAGVPFTNFPGGVILPCNSPFFAGNGLFNNFFFGSSAFSMFGFPGFGGIFFPQLAPVGTATFISPVGGNVPTIVTQPVLSPVFSSPLSTSPFFGITGNYPGFRGTGSYLTQPYTQTSTGNDQQQQEQQQQVSDPSSGIVMTQQQQQQQQGGGGGYGGGGYGGGGYGGGGSDQQQQEQQQSIS